MTLKPIGVAAENVTLSQFVPTDGEEGWSFDTDFIATLKPNGAFDTQYGYLSPFWAGPEGLDTDDPEAATGWYLFSELKKENIDGERYDNANIPLGTGLVVYTGTKGVSVQFAGQVLMDDYGIPLSFNANTFTGVVCPADLTLGELEPTGGEEGWSFDTDFVATLKPNGAFDTQYGYLSPFWAGPEGLDTDDPEAATGWYLFSELKKENIDGERYDNLPLTSGQAFIVYTGSKNVELVVPSAVK